MAVTVYIPNDRVPPDLLLWRTFRREVPGLVEQALDTNYRLADLGVFPPAGTPITIEPPVAASGVKTIPLVRLY